MSILKDRKKFAFLQIYNIYIPDTTTDHIIFFADIYTRHHDRSHNPLLRMRARGNNEGTKETLSTDAYNKLSCSQLVLTYPCILIGGMLKSVLTGGGPLDVPY